MGGRLWRLSQCAELDGLELVSASLPHGYCAPIDNQGLYFLSKVISNFMGIGIEASALFILYSSYLYFFVPVTFLALVPLSHSDTFIRYSCH
jgi:hypothetical protein